MFKSLKTQVKYRIEGVPGGGFVARADDPSHSPIEGKTREEVQKKIGAQLLQDLAAQLPMVKNALQFQIQHHESGEAAATVVVRSHGSEKQLIDLSGSDRIGELAKQWGELVTKNAPSLPDARGIAAAGALSAGESFQNGNSDQSRMELNAPIVPEKSNFRQWILPALLVIGSLLYFLLLRR